MTHDEAIEALLDRIGRGSTAAAENPSEAVAHVAACPECWALARLLLEEAATDQSVVRDLYGCDEVRSQFYRFAGLTPAEVRERYPQAVDHVRWCRACREDLATFLAIEPIAQGAAVGEYATDELCWRESLAEGGERLYELLSRLIVRAGEAVAVFQSLPSDLAPMPFGAAAPVLRGNERVHTLSLTSIGQRVALALGDSGITAHIAVEPVGAAESLRLSVEVEGARGAVAMIVRKTSDGAGRIVAAQSTAERVPLIVPRVAPGRYEVDVSEAEPVRRFRVTVDVTAGREG